jgi:hypothetical protein
MATCPNKNLESWQNLVVSRGNDVAHYLWDKYDGIVPESESKESVVKAGLKAVNALQTDKAVTLFSTLDRNKVTGDRFWNKVQADLQIPKEQIELLKQYNTINREELVANMLGDYSFAIEINVAKRDVVEEPWRMQVEDYETDDRGFPIPGATPTQFYSNLTVPGGTNYTENEIATPAITPAIRGHAQFATDKGIGWFRSDDSVVGIQNRKALPQEIEEARDTQGVQAAKELEKNGVPSVGGTLTKTRRILELQSDLFQKGRDKSDLVNQKPGDFEDEIKQESDGTWSIYNNLVGLIEGGFKSEKEAIAFSGPSKEDVSKNQFLQLLNKDNNWVTFFIKSIIQDSAKKGYNKVLFPKGDTASKVEGHSTLEEFKREKEDRIKFVESEKEKILEMKGMSEQEYLNTKPELNSIESINREINQLKQELERVEREGFGALKPIYNFYETTVTNVLKKQGYSPKVVTDEYGNQWNEVALNKEREREKILFQIEGVPTSRASESTVAKMKEAAKQMGINIQSLADYAKANPNIDTKGVNGVADLAKMSVAVAAGREDVALTEEIVHISRAMIEQVDPKLVTEMISKIERFKIYKQVFEKYKDNPYYQLSDGRPNIRKIKMEAVDKLITEVIINRNEGTTEYPELMQEETRSLIQQWWDAIKDMIRSIYRKSTIDVFEEAAARIEGGELVTDSLGNEVFLQIASNDEVNKFYDTLAQMDASMNIITTDPNDRHYTYNNERVARSVTQKIKEEVGRQFERSPMDKLEDDQKRDWGTDVHAFLQDYVTNNLIDKDGFARAQFLDTPVESRLSSAIQERLRNFAKELIRSYKPGTRFRIESKIVNTKAKGMIGTTADFIAIEPDEKKGFVVDMFDWKTTSIDKTKDEDVPWYKQKEWKMQMGEQSKIMYNLKVQPDQLRKARMIPFLANYTYAVQGDRQSGLVLSSMEIGKLDNLQETNLYLLPVPLNTESTGNPEVDRLLASMRQYYEKLYKVPVSPEEKYAKNLMLNEISKAIRHLHMKLDFGPLANVGRTFLNNAAETLKTFENIDYKTLSKEELRKKLGDLLEYRTSAEKFATMDEVFINHIGKENLRDEDKKTLKSLEEINNSTGRMLKKIDQLQKDFVVQYAIKENFIEDTEAAKENFLAAEKEVDGLSKTFLEGSKLAPVNIRLASNLIMNAKSLVNIKMSRLINEFEKLLLPLYEDANRSGRSAFDMIGTVNNGRLQLIKKIDRKFWDEIAKNAKARNKQFFLENMDREKYNALAKEAIDRGIKELNTIKFSSDPDQDELKRKFRIKQLRNSLDINLETFNGYNQGQFKYLFNQTMKEEGHYSPEYLQMRGNENAMKMWTFLTNLNQRAKQLGYLDQEGMSFFPLIEATLLQKISQSSETTKQIKDFFNDMYTTKIDELPAHAKIDPETGEVKRQIPRFFTRTEKAVDELSKDLNKVGTLWIKALLEYENAKEMENILLTLHNVEESKGHIITAPDGSIVYEGNVPRVGDDNIKNAALLKTIIDDEVYGITEDLSSLGNVNMNRLAGQLQKDEESKEKTVLSIKKGLDTSNVLVRALAVGLKPLIAIANYAGFNFQAFINAGNMYRFREFEAQNLAITTGVGLSTLDKGLIDLVVPLNEDISAEKRRGIAWKQGFREYLGTWTFTDVMMSTNAFPDRKLQLANALAFNKNSMVMDGKIVNIRQYVKAQDRARYKTMSEAERRTYEKGYEERVKALKESSSLDKVAKIEDGQVVIPGVSDEELAKYRTKVIEYGRNLSGQMNSDNKAGYRRDALFRSFMMFKTWIPKQIFVRGQDIQKSEEQEEWEYGRTRLFFKTWAQLGLFNVFQMRQVLLGTDKGLKILDEMLEAKREDHFKKTGKKLEITDEEFYDLVRRQLSNQMKELGLLFSVMGLVIAAKAAEPPEDADELTRNRYKFWAKAINKISDELKFYYDPRSFESITKGSVMPAVGLISKSAQLIDNLQREVTGYAINDEKMMEKAHPIKYALNLMPVGYQFQTEVLPYIDPELAKSLGIRVTTESRIR